MTINEEKVLALRKVIQNKVVIKSLNSKDVLFVRLGAWIIWVNEQRLLEEIEKNYQKDRSYTASQYFNFITIETWKMGGLCSIQWSIWLSSEKIDYTYCVIMKCKLYCVKYLNFTEFPGVEILWRDTVIWVSCCLGTVEPWWSGYHYHKSLIKNARAQVLRRFISCSQSNGGLQ